MHKARSRAISLTRRRLLAGVSTKLLIALGKEDEAATLIGNLGSEADKARTPANDPVSKGSSLVRGVGPPGLEPGTYGLKVRSSAN